MKLPVLLVICTCCLNLTMSKSEPATDREPKNKPSTKHNSLSTTPKPEPQYQTIQQPQPQYQQSYQQQPQYHQQPLQPILQRHLPTRVQQVLIPHHQLQQIQYQPQVQVPGQPQVQVQGQPQQNVAHLFQRAFYIPQQPNQPTAMIIIAQPAYVPVVPRAVQGGATQHLLNYFHSNPQARYQFLHGNYQPQPAHTIGNYVVAVPAHYQQNVVAVPVHRPHLAPLAQTQDEPTSSAEVTQQQATPLQLAEIAQIASHQYSRINPAQEAETAQSAQPHQYHYQPESRAQPAVAQQAVPVRSLPPIFTGFENFSPEQQEKIKAQLSEHFGAPLQPLPADRVPLAQGQGNQYLSKYQPQPGFNRNEFVPSEQVKTDSSSPNVSSNKSAHYTNA